MEDLTKRKDGRMGDKRDRDRDRVKGERKTWIYYGENSMEDLERGWKEKREIREN